MYNKKGQAAMEFLMTYGWAILAAIVVIAVLAIYFNPSNLASNAQVLGAPFNAVSSSVNTTTVQLEVTNNGAETVNLTSFVVTVKNPTGGSCTTTTVNALLGPSEQRVLDASCTGLTVDSRFSADVGLKYLTLGSSLEQVATGNIARKIQSS